MYSDEEELLCSNVPTIRDLYRRSQSESKSNVDKEYAKQLSEEIGPFDSDCEDEDYAPFRKSFDELKGQMIAINEHIHKRIILPGDVNKGLMAERSRVLLHYNAYWEGEDEAFDSTTLRGVFTFRSGCDEVIEGLEAAARTMYCGEDAQFIISHKLLFDETDTRPRVKPGKDALFVIEMISFNDLDCLCADVQINPRDFNKYFMLVAKVEQINQQGRDFFAKQSYKNACRAFHKALHILNFCEDLENAKEFRAYTEFIIKLHTNLAVCYNKMNMPEKASGMCNGIWSLSGNKPTCKALFTEGRALMMLGKYERAREVLLKAQKMEPQNEAINKEIKEMEDRFKRYKENEKSMWQKAMVSKIM